LIGAKITELISDSIFQTVITTNQPQYNKQFLINENIVIANSFPLYIKDRAVGTVITFSNLTEANRLAEELTGVRKIVEALRARTHEFSNKLHAISGLIELGSYEEAKKYVTRVASNERTLISCLLSNFRANAVAGLLMGKVSEAEEKGIRYEIDKDSNLFTLPDYFDEHALVIVLGNLIENAFDAAKKHADNPEVHVSVKQTETMIEIKVRDNGPGISPKLKDKIFEPGFTTKSSGTGYGLYNVKSRVKMANGEISFTNEKKGTTFFLNIPFDVLLEQKQGGER
jgi:sensor histidine kinase regulating citrate/malate metabolism